MVARGVVTSYMSRIYLAPRSVHPADGTELWINFGWNTKGNVMFPEWIPALNSVCSKDEYDRLAMRVRDYVNKNGLDMCVTKSYSAGCVVLAMAGPLAGTVLSVGESSVIPMMPVFGLVPSVVCCPRFSCSR